VKIMADNNNIENGAKKSPLSKIKTKNIMFIGAGIIAVLIMALFRMSANQNKMLREEKNVKSEVQSETENNNIGFEVVDYSQATKEDEEAEENELTYLNEKKVEENKENEEDVEEYAREEIEIPKNEKRESFYEALLSDELSARASIIEFGGNENLANNNRKASNNGELPIINLPPELEEGQVNNFMSEDINKQPEKKAFLNQEKARKNYNEDLISSPVSKYEVKMGGIIPGILQTGINSDLPGSMTAIVREDVYDTVSGRYLLIPKGTRVIGKYSSFISFGQSRVLVVWQRLIFPNGKSINLDNFEGADMSGYSGLIGDVDNHTLKLLQGVVLASVLGAAAGIVDDRGDDRGSWRNGAGRGAGEEVITLGETMANRLLSVQPTIKIQPGTRFNIMVNSDLVLEPYKN
jgi:conjugation trbI family protein